MGITLTFKQMNGLSSSINKMSKLINLLYSCAAGLEQAYATYHTIKQAHKVAAQLALGGPPEARQPIGFTGKIPTNPAPSFTSENPCL